MLDWLAGRHAAHDVRELVAVVVGDKDADITAEDFTSRIPVHPLGPAIPAQDRAVQILREDRVVGGLDDSGENPGRFVVR